MTRSGRSTVVDVGIRGGNGELSALVRQIVAVRSLSTPAGRSGP